MIKKSASEDLLKYYYREGAWAKFEALYISVTDIDGFYNASKNIRIRYGSEEPVNEVKADIERVFGETSILGKGRV